MGKIPGLEDVRAYFQVIGCLLQDNTLIDDLNRPLQREDFNTNAFYEILYVAIYNTYMAGAQVIDEFAIDSYLKNFKEQYKIFEANDGINWLYDAKTIAELGNYDYNYSRLRKLSLLRYYENQGYDTRRVYDTTLSDARSAENEQLKFDNMTTQDIVDQVEGDLVLVPKAKFCANMLAQSCLAGDGLDELTDELMESPAFGYPFTSAAFNTVSYGAARGKFILRSASTGSGKALPNDTVIPTPNGWRKVGDVRPGDYLFGRDGKPTKVLQIHPQQYPKQVWEVELKDGRVVKCCGEHLWEYKYQGHRGWDTAVNTTEEIYNHAMQLGGFKSGRKIRYRLPLNEAVEYPAKKVSVHPYVMGALIANGSFRYNDRQKGLAFSSDDIETVNKVARLLGDNVVGHKNSGRNYSYTFKPYKGARHNLWVEEILADYSELWQKKSHEKHIPKDYLLGSVEQRWELLRGLMDTDGHISLKGGTSYTTTSPQLRDDFIELCRSLGFITHCIVDKREKYTTGEAYCIRFVCKKHDKIKCFTLTRKKNRAIDYISNDKREEHKDSLPIVDIRKTGEYAEMTCFTVDNEDHLFLANDFVVTHNTRNFLMDACNFAVPYVWDIKKKDFVYTGHRVPTLFIGTEGSIREFQTIVQATVSGVNEAHIKKGKYEPGELDRVRKANQYIKESPLYLVYCDDFSIADIENMAKRYVLTHNIEIFIFDYLQTSLRMIQEISTNARGTKLQEYQLLLIFSTRLKALAERLDICIISGTQLSAEANDARYKTNQVLQGSKAIAQKVDVGVILSRPNPAERKKLDAIMKNMVNVPEVNLLTWCYKVRAGELSSVIICSNINLGTMKIRDCFITDFDFNLIDVDFTQIEVMNEVLESNSVDINETDFKNDPRYMQVEEDTKDEPIETPKQKKQKLVF